MVEASSTEPVRAALSTVAVRNIHLRPAPPIEDASSVHVTFDIENQGTRGVTDIGITVVLLEKRHDGEVETPRSIVAGPFAVRANAVLPPGYTLDYEICLGDISSDCGCDPSSRLYAHASCLSREPRLAVPPNTVDCLRDRMRGIRVLAD